MNNWDLNKLYSSYESKEFQDDLLKVDNLINGYIFILLRKTSWQKNVFL